MHNARVRLHFCKGSDQSICQGVCIGKTSPFGSKWYDAIYVAIYGAMIKFPDTTTDIPIHSFIGETNQEI